MGMELGNQVLIQVRKEMSGNMKTVKSEFAGWLERPDSGGVSSLAEKLSEISGSLSLLGYADAAKLTDVILSSIQNLNHNISNKKSDTPNILEEGADIASAILVLEDFIERLGSVKELDLEFVKHSYQTLLNGERQRSDLVDFNITPNVDAQTYEVIAGNISEILSKSRQQIEQYHKSDNKEQIIAEIKERNSELADLFVVLGMSDPKILLNKINELIDSNPTPELWVDIAEAMLLVETAFVAGQKDGSLDNEEGEDLLSKQKSFNRRLIVEDVLKEIGGQAIYYFEQFRKEVALQEKVDSSHDWKEMSLRVAHYQSFIELAGLKRFSDVLKQLGVIYLTISLHKQSFATELYAPIVDSLVGIEYLFNDIALMGKVSDQDVSFLEKAVESINKILPENPQAMKLYQQFADDVSEDNLSGSSNLLSDLDVGLDALDGNYSAAEFFEQEEQEQEEDVNESLDTELPLGETAQDEARSTEELSANKKEELGANKKVDNSLAQEEVKAERSAKNNANDGVGAFGGLGESVTQSSENARVNTVVDFSNVGSDSASATQESQQSITAILSSDEQQSNRSASAISGQYYLNKSLEDLNNIEVPKEKAEFSVTHEDAVVDDEIREFFLEELDEIIEFLGETIPLFQEEPENLENTKEIRRSFHTLKGSGRTVGYESLGEFAWQHEQLLNNVMEGQYPVSPLVQHTVSDAYQLLLLLRSGGQFEEKKGALLEQALVAQKVREALLVDPDTGNIDNYINQLRNELLSGEVQSEEISSATSAKVGEFESTAELSNETAPYSIQGEPSSVDAGKALDFDDKASKEESLLSARQSEEKSLTFSLVDDDKEEFGTINASDDAKLHDQETNKHASQRSNDGLALVDDFVDTAESVTDENKTQEAFLSKSEKVSSPQKSSDESSLSKKAQSTVGLSLTDELEQSSEQKTATQSFAPNQSESPVFVDTLTQEDKASLESDVETLSFDLFDDFEETSGVSDASIEQVYSDSDAVSEGFAADLNQSSQSGQNYKNTQTGVDAKTYQKMLTSLKQVSKHGGDLSTQDDAVISALQYQMQQYDLPEDNNTLSALTAQIKQDLEQQGIAAGQWVNAVFSTQHEGTTTDEPISASASPIDHSLSESTASLSKDKQEAFAKISQRLSHGMAVAQHDEASVEAFANLLENQWQQLELPQDEQARTALRAHLVEALENIQTEDKDFLADVVANFANKTSSDEKAEGHAQTISSYGSTDSAESGAEQSIDKAVDSLAENKTVNAVSSLSTQIEDDSSLDVQEFSLEKSSDEGESVLGASLTESDGVQGKNEQLVSLTNTQDNDEEATTSENEIALTTSNANAEQEQSLELSDKQAVDLSILDKEEKGISSEVAQISKVSDSSEDETKFDVALSASQQELLESGNLESINKEEYQTSADLTQSGRLNEVEYQQVAGGVESTLEQSDSSSKIATTSKQEEGQTSEKENLAIPSWEAQEVEAKEISQEFAVAEKEFSVDAKKNQNSVAEEVVPAKTAQSNYQQRLDQELSQLAQHPTLKEESATAKKQDEEYRQAVYLRAMDKLEPLTNAESLSKNAAGELIEAFYDIEESLNPDTAPQWLWRLLDAIEQLLLLYQENDVAIPASLTSTLREGIELIQDHAQNDGSEVDEVISKLMKERQQHADIPVSSLAYEKLASTADSAPVKTVAELLSREDVLDPNANSFLSETFLDEALVLLAKSQEDAEMWSDNLEQLSRLDNIRRNMHTLKGSALMAGYQALGNLAHTTESLIERVVEGQVPASSRSASLLLGAIWQGLLMLDSIRDGFLPKEDPYLLNNISGFINEPLPYPEIAEAIQQEKEAVEQKKHQQDTQEVAKEDTLSEPLVEEQIEAHGFDDSIDPVLVEIFSDEAQEIIENIQQQVNDNLNDKENLDELKRALHTLKGGARLVGIFSIGNTAHEMESIVENLDDYSEAKKRQAKTLLQHGSNTLLDMLDTMLRRELPEEAGSLNEALSLFAQTGEFKLPEPKKAEPEDTQVAELQNLTEEEKGSTQANVHDESIALSDEKDSLEPLTKESAQLEENAESLEKSLGAIEAEKPEEQLPAKKEDSIEQYKETVKEKNTSKQPTSTLPHLVRVDAKLLDELIAMVGEMAILRSRFETLVATTDYSLTELSRVAIRIGEQTRRLDSETEAQMLFRHEQHGYKNEEFDPLEMDRFSEMQQLSRQLAEAVDDLKNLNDSLEHDNSLIRNITHQQALLQRNIQSSLMTTQMMRFDVHEPRLRRLVKQTSLTLGCEVDFILQGGEVELERRLLEDILPALEHIVRNAIAHGIEKPEERVRKGKTRSGTIKIDVSLNASELVVRIIDDGKGLDFDAIRRKASEKGILDPERQNDERYLSSLIFKSGFSTAKSLSQVSGRGVGMDVVNEMVKQRRGRILAQSIADKGTEFAINIPFSMSISEVLLIEIAGQTYAAPMSSVAAVSQIPAEKLQQALQGETVYHEYNSEEYRLFVLGQYFSPEGYEVTSEDGTLPVLYVNAGDTKVALFIDRILNRVEIIVKNVNRQLLNIPGILGATILGDGSVVPVLELVDLSRHVSSVTPMQDASVVDEQELRQAHILVVDDSVTMRKVATRLLERHNYVVRSAKDGIDAIEALEEFTPDLILLDIEMPRMDGFEFANHVRQNSQIPEVPIIMITSRTGDKHRVRADMIGVQGYLGKPYREDVLIETIESMLEESK